MERHLTYEEIRDYLEGECLSEETASSWREAEEHLGSCSRCREILRRYLMASQVAEEFLAEELLGVLNHETELVKEYHWNRMAVRLTGSPLYARITDWIKQWKRDEEIEFRVCIRDPDREKISGGELLKAGQDSAFSDFKPVYAIGARGFGQQKAQIASHLVSGMEPANTLTVRGDERTLCLRLNGKESKKPPLGMLCPLDWKRDCQIKEGIWMAGEKQYELLFEGLEDGAYLFYVLEENGDS